MWYQLIRHRHGDPMPYGIGYKGIDNVIPCLIVLVLAKVSLLGHGITLAWGVMYDERQCNVSSLGSNV